MRHGKNETASILLRELAASMPGPVSVRGMAAGLKDEVAVFLAPLLLPMPFECVRAMLDSPEQKEDFRLLMQWWGSFRRSYYGEDYWLERFGDWLDRQPADAVVVIDDLRYPNEAEFVKSRGGMLVRIERPGYGKPDAHPSETSMDDYLHFSATVVNDCCLEHLQEKVKRVCPAILAATDL